MKRERDQFMYAYYHNNFKDSSLKKKVLQLTINKLDKYPTKKFFN